MKPRLLLLLVLVLSLATSRAEEPNQATELNRKEVQANAYVGRTYWYLPNPQAVRRIRFFGDIPSSSHSEEPSLIFFPDSVTSFVVTGVLMPPPVIYPPGKDEYLLKIQFAGGRVSYVNVVGCCGLSRNTYAGKLAPDREYVTTEPPNQELIADIERTLQQAQDRKADERRRQELHREETADERAARIEREADEYSKKLQADLHRRNEEERKAVEEARKAEAQRRARMSLPQPRIGMTAFQVINRTSWGRPDKINRTTTSSGTREQWVYDSGRYLYFRDGTLVTIQD